MSRHCHVVCWHLTVNLSPSARLEHDRSPTHQPCCRKNNVIFSNPYDLHVIPRYAMRVNAWVDDSMSANPNESVKNPPKSQYCSSIWAFSPSAGTLSLVARGTAVESGRFVGKEWNFSCQRISFKLLRFFFTTDDGLDMCDVLFGKLSGPSSWFER